MSPKLVHRILRKYPERWSQILELTETDPQFRSVCADLEDAALAANRWHRSAEKSARERELEYLNIVRHLEAELLEKLDDKPCNPNI